MWVTCHARMRRASGFFAHREWLGAIARAASVIACRSISERGAKLTRVLMGRPTDCAKLRPEWRTAIFSTDCEFFTAADARAYELTIASISEIETVWRSELPVAGK